MAGTPAHLAIGRIVQAHGIKGELAVFPLTARAERFAAGATIHLSRTPEGEGTRTPIRITASRRHKENVLLALEGIGDRTEAEKHVGLYLVIPREEAETARAEDEFFLHALVGREVRTEAGEPVGVVADVVETGAAPLLEIEAPGRGRRLLPFVREFVRSVEDDAVVVAPPEGWTEI